MGRCNGKTKGTKKINKKDSLRVFFYFANIEKKIPLEWIDVDNNYVKDELVAYLKPLIQGEVKQIYKDGIPQHINLKNE